MELAKKRLETAILRLEALINALPAGQLSERSRSSEEPGVAAEQSNASERATLTTAENEALRTQLEAVHDENVKLRASLDGMGSRMDRIILRLEDVVSASRSSEATARADALEVEGQSPADQPAEDHFSEEPGFDIADDDATEDRPWDS